MLTYFANHIKEWWHPGKPKSNTHQEKTSIEGELKVTSCSDSNGKIFVRLSADFPVSSDDIAKDASKILIMPTHMKKITIPRLLLLLLLLLPRRMVLVQLVIALSQWKLKVSQLQLHIHLPTTTAHTLGASAAV